MAPQTELGGVAEQEPAAVGRRGGGKELLQPRRPKVLEEESQLKQEGEGEAGKRRQ